MKVLELNEKSVITDTLEGLVLANPELLVLEKNMIINKALAKANRVALVAMSTAGNEPALAGYVGEGLLDIAVVGNMDSAPGPAAVLEAIGLADRGQGVLLVVLNNLGDILTSNIVLKQAEKQGFLLRRVIVHDLRNAFEQLGQGTVGVLPVLKIAGAAAAEGKSLAEIAELAESCAGLQLTVGVPIAQTSVDEIAEAAVKDFVNKLQLEAGDTVLLLVNGNSNASLQEQLILFRSCYLAFKQLEITVTGNANDYFCGIPELSVEICCVKLTEYMGSLWRKTCKAAYFKS